MEYEAHCCIEKGGTYVVARTRLAQADALQSVADVFAGADRPERHAHDLTGIRLLDQPDTRRWTRHAAWGAEEFPLRDKVAPPQRDTALDQGYPFVQAAGPGVVEIPVGPVHAGIIEPGHFRFQAMGETVLNLEERLGYVHKGIEYLARGRDAAGLARIAGRVSGDCTVGHAWAACMALERAAGVQIPERAAWLRAILLERERIANHLGDIGAICNDVAFSFAQMQLTRLRENCLRDNLLLFSHRLLMDQVVPGGVLTDLDENGCRRLLDAARSLKAEFSEIIAILEDSESLEDRLMTTGRLEPETAAQLGVVGYVGRASGQAFDVRRDAPHAPYDRIPPRVPAYRAGDVAARAKVRAEEVGASLDIMEALLASIPDGECRTQWTPRAMRSEGLGMVEGWRGEIIAYVCLDGNGTVERYFPRDPSWLTWPALELLMQGNIVPDFPVCNKSVNASYSGHDL